MFSARGRANIHGIRDDRLGIGKPDQTGDRRRLRSHRRTPARLQYRKMMPGRFLLPHARPACKNGCDASRALPTPQVFPVFSKSHLMDFLFGDLPTILVFAVILPWIAAPVVAYFTAEMPILPEFFPVTDTDIESCTTPAFLDRSRSMEALGFEQAANLQWITPTTRCFMRLF